MEKRNKKRNLEQVLREAIEASNNALNMKNDNIGYFEAAMEKCKVATNQVLLKADMGI